MVSLLLPWRSKRPYGPSQHNLNIYGMNILWNCMMFSTAHYDSFSWMLLIYFTVIGNLSVRWFSVFCICLGLGGIFVLGWFSGSFSGFIIFGGFLQNSLLPEVFGTDPLWHFLCWWWVSQIILKESFLAVKRAFFWSTLQTWFSKMSGRCGQDEDLLIFCLNLNLHLPSISHLN